MADLYPRFSLNGLFTLQSSDVGTLVRWDSRSFAFGPALQWPILDAGRLRAVVRARDAQQEQTLIQYEQTVLQAVEEVHDALASFTTEQDRRKSLQAAVKANQDSAELAAELYRQGLTDFTTVLDAQRQLYQSQESLLQSEATVTMAFVALYKALGGGWEMDSPPARQQPKPSR